jgi:uncharacterized protein with NAD-binding domain and iron-sulfur cluster
MAGLTAAWELTRTPQLAEENDVTVFQLGWRLGGKCASGRTEPTAGEPLDSRILEHGLHIWFGCYDNAFRVLKEAYAHWERPANCPLKSWRDAFEPQSYALFGYDAGNGKRDYHAITFDGNSKEPGTGDVSSSLGDLAVTLYRLVRDLLHEEFRDDQSSDEEQPHLLDPLPTPFVLAPFRRAAAEAWTIGARVLDHAGVDFTRPYFEAVKRSTHEAAATLRQGVDGQDERERQRQRLLQEGLDLTGAVLRGVISDCYLQRKSIDALDAEEFTTWLERHECDLKVPGSTLLQTMYDTFFWYGEGDPRRPNVGAGTAITVILRAMCTYKQAITFKMTAGMGEVVVAPMYEVLRQRRVKFKFFHKVTRLELGAQQTLRRVHLSRQADILENKEYVPTFSQGGLSCWPSEPRWEQLRDGAALKAKGVSFESHWEQHSVGSEVLEVDGAANANGATFTHVIMAVSLGAFKKLNQDAGMCDELLAASPAFSDMAASMDLVPSQAAQLWSTRRTGELGDYAAGYESVAGPQPLPIWADMSQVLLREQHPAAGPKSLHYGCGTFKTELYKETLAARDTEKRALELVRNEVKGWLNERSAGLWRHATHNATFDWNVLYDPQDRVGAARLEAQYIRANVTPTECCPGTPPGSSAKRLRSEESGFKNLFLAGCYTRTGLNTTCVEGAVMSGMQASRAVCGSPRLVVGEDFGRNLGRDERAARAPGPGLPTYVSQLGMGQMSHEAPLLVSDVQMHAFRLSGKRWRMQRLVDENLNLPSMRAGSSVRFTVLGNSALLAFLYSAAAGPSAPDNRVGVMDDREAALFIPLLQRDGLQLKLTAWVPYLFIDRPIGMTMGREVWGYTKSAAQIAWPRPADDYRVVTSTLKVHAPQTVASDEEVLRLYRTQEQPAPLGASIWTTLGEVIAALVPEAALMKLLPGRNLPVVNLKQFRDVENSKLACYQALVESPMEVGKSFNAGWLDTSGMKLDVFTCDSHQIVTQFGLANALGADVTTLNVKQGVWAKLSFTATHGRTLWKLP